MEKIEKDSKVMASSYAAEKKEVEARVIKMEEEAKKEKERVEAEHNRQLAGLNHHLQDTVGASAEDQARLQQETREERQRAEVEHKRQLADLERHLRDVISASATDRAKWEQIRRHQAELTENNKVVGQKLEEQTRELQRQMGKIRKDSEELGAMMKDVEQGTKEREQARAEHQSQLATLTRRLQDETNVSMDHRVRLKQEAKEREQTEAEHRRQLIDFTLRLQEEIDASVAYRARLEQGAREERQQAEAEHRRQLADLERHLRDATSASVADRAKWEEIRRHQAELTENDEATRRKLEERTRELQGQTEKIKKDSEELGARMKEVEQGVKERERAGAEHQLQLANLTRRLQDEINASVAFRAREGRQQTDGLDHRPQDTPNASAAGRAKWEQIGRHQAELREKDEVMRQNFEEPMGGLERQREKVKKDSDGPEARMEEMAQGAKEEGRAEVEHKRQSADLTRSLQDETDTSVAHRVRLEQETREERRQAEAENKQQLANSERLLRDMADASAAGRVKWEQIRGHRVELEEKGEVVRQDSTRNLQGESNTSVVSRVRLEWEARGEKQLAEVGPRRQLADLARRLQGETNTPGAHRVMSGQETKKSQDRVVTTATMPLRLPPRVPPRVPPRLPPRPTPYVQTLFRLATAIADVSRVIGARASRASQGQIRLQYWLR